MERVAVIWISLVFFCALLPYPALLTATPGSYQGFLCLIGGWTALLHGQPAWLANFALLACYVLLMAKMKEGALIVGVIALALGLSALGIKEIWDTRACPLTGFGVGFDLWICSLVTPLVGVIIFIFHPRPSS